MHHKNFMSKICSGNEEGNDQMPQCLYKGFLTFEEGLLKRSDYKDHHQVN